MRNLTSTPEINKARIHHITEGWGDDKSGAFQFDRPGLKFGTRMLVVAASDGGWDHVSVSVFARTPTWEEMEWVKRLFFHDNEVVMQLHVATSDHINIHPHVLHLWRPTELTIPLPPKEFV